MKALLFSTALFFSIFTFSQSKDTDKRFEATIDLNVGAADVWTLLTDVARWKEWDTHVIDAKLIDGFAPKAQGKLVTKNAKAIDFGIQESQEGVGYTLRHKLSSGTLFIKRSISETDSGALLTANVWYTGISPKNFKKYMGADYTGILEAELKMLKSLAEN